MRFSNVIEQVFTVTSVSGSEHLCFCPFHEDTSQGHLYCNGDNGYYICFSCGAKGHVEKLADTLPPLETEDIRSRIMAVSSKKNRRERVYPEGWLRQFNFPTDYWTEERGISGFPVCDVTALLLKRIPYSHAFSVIQIPTFYLMCSGCGAP